MAVLQVGICGAGVAGLAAAIALRKVGHDVEVSLIHVFCLDAGKKHCQSCLFHNKSRPLTLFIAF